MRSFISLSTLALATGVAAKGVSTTPHDKYSSSIGVLGCKINTDRVAYWPGSVDCDNICVKLTHGSRSVHLLRIDQSGGAYDISYDAWAYLQTGESASSDPVTGGGVAMEYEEVDASECADLIYTEGSKLPLSASNSMNFLTSCLSQPDSFVAKNHVLYNICDAICTLGHDEECELDLSVSNQPSCPHTLGLTVELTAETPVIDIEYQSGNRVYAGSGDAAPASNASPAEEVSEPAEETEDTSSPSPPSPPPQPATTAEVQTTAEDGIFYEVSGTLVSSTEPVEQAVETVAPPPPATTAPSAPAAVVSTSSSVAIETEEAPSSTEVPSAPIAPTPSSSSSTFTFVTSVISSSASLTTFSASTVRPTPSSSQTTPSGTPGSEPTPPAENAGNMPSMPILALLSSMLLSIFVLF